MAPIVVNTPLMTDSSPGDLTKLYLHSATVPGKPKVYFVGPFGRRVSFASQQRRALNTIWAVGQLKAFENNPHVAVIGAGLAGITTCAALLAKKCRVTLFEKGDSVLARQSRTTHRFLHPTINFWPEKHLEPTTSLPYLDWHEGLCSDVIQAIDAEWKKYFLKSLANLHCRTLVKAVEPSNEKVVLKVLKHAGRPDEVEMSATFDMAFVTTGFGDEALLSASDKSYWEPDELEGIRDAGTKSFVVGGTGDGGMLDALRLVQTSFGCGELCLNLINELNEHGIDTQVARIEKEVWELASHSETEAAVLYHRRYTEALETFPTIIRELLASRHHDVRVRLVGKLPQPFGLFVAPIHKMMMASALADGAVEYVRGALELVDNKYYIKARNNRSTAIDDGSKVVVRIGPKHPLALLLKEEQIAVLANMQRTMSDLLAPTELDDSFFEGFRDFPKKDVKDPRFVSFRKPLADSFLVKKFKGKSKLEFDVNGPFYVLMREFRDPESIKKLPGKLFGIDLKEQLIAVGEGL